jgi:hypothetical protein
MGSVTHQPFRWLQGFVLWPWGEQLEAAPRAHVGNVEEWRFVATREML